MKLSQYTSGRDNNFSLLRFLAAFAVLVTHSYALSTGTGQAEPLRDQLGMTLGSFAVDIFFVTSGHLVAASLLKRQSVAYFLRARVLRIFPALLFAVLLTVFLLGTFLTKLPLRTYLTSGKTYYYLVKCATVIGGVAYELPGVFETNPYPRAVNGSLWTMPYELQMYIILSLVWMVSIFFGRRRILSFSVFIITSAFVSGIFTLSNYFSPPIAGSFSKLFFMFTAGASMYILRQKIEMNGVAFFLLLASLFLSGMQSKFYFELLYTVSLPYIILYFAYVPAGYIRRYNVFGDYSYGLYIFAFPVQQSIATEIPGISIFHMIALASLIAIPLSVISWHYLEEPALRGKGYA